MPHFVTLDTCGGIFALKTDLLLLIEYHCLFHGYTLWVDPEASCHSRSRYIVLGCIYVAPSIYLVGRGGRVKSEFLKQRR